MSYLCNTRTSYFHVIDESAFRAVIAELLTHEESDVFIWKKQDEDGKDIFAFGCYGRIRGILPEDETAYSNSDDPEFACFIERLQACLVEGDVIIITEVGNENLRYLGATAVIIGKHRHKFVDFMDVTVGMANEVEPNWPEGARLDG